MEGNEKGLQWISKGPSLYDIFQKLEDFNRRWQELSNPFLDLEEKRRLQEEMQLIAAVRAGDHSEAERLLESGVSPHITDTDGKGLLNIAEYRRDKPMCRLLHRHGAISYAMETSLVAAVGDGNHSEAKLLLKSGVSPYITDWNGKSLLSIAKERNDMPMRLLLLKATGPSLLAAVKNGDHSEAKWLLESGVSPHITDMVGKGLLSIAEERRDKPICTLLLAYGANSKAMETSLLAAVRNGDQSRAEWLLEFGVSPHITDTDGEDLLSIAGESHDVNMCRLLHIYGASSEAMEASLITAVRAGNHRGAVRMLVYGVSPHITDTDGTGLLSIALAEKTHNMCMYILLLKAMKAYLHLFIGDPANSSSSTASVYNKGLWHIQPTRTQMNWLTQMSRIIIAALNLRMIVAMEMLGTVLLSITITESWKSWTVIQNEYLGMVKQEWRITRGVREKCI